MFDIKEFSDSLVALIASEQSLQRRNIKLEQDVQYWRDEWAKLKGIPTDTEIALDNEIRLLTEQG